MIDYFELQCRKTFQKNFTLLPLLGTGDGSRSHSVISVFQRHICRTQNRPLSYGSYLSCGDGLGGREPSSGLGTDLP